MRGLQPGIESKNQSLALVPKKHEDWADGADYCIHLDTRWYIPFSLEGPWPRLWVTSQTVGFFARVLDDNLEKNSCFY
jgi:hypothetical protein